MFKPVSSDASERTPFVGGAFGGAPIVIPPVALHSLAVPSPLLLLQVAVILALCRLATPVFARLRQPAVIAEMTVGLLLGPSFFGWLAPGAWASLFPPSSLPALSMLSQIGLVLFMFLVGWRLDVGHSAP